MKYFIEFWHKLTSTISSFFPKPNTTKAKRKRGKRAEIFGEYQTIKALLNDLDGVFKDYKKLSKNRESETVKLINKFGAHVSCMSEDSGDSINASQLEGFKAHGLPTFLISYSSIKNEQFIQYFFTAVKTTRADFGQTKQGCIYYDVVLNITDDKAEKKFNGKPVALRYCIEVNKSTGVVRALPFQTTKIHQIRYHNKSKTGPSFHSIPTKLWEYPDLISYNEKAYTQKEVRAHLQQHFTVHYGLVMRRETGINLHIRKGKTKVTINVPHNEWKYFFKDRIKAKTAQGNTKPIYHAVASHFREVKSGVTTVKTHYRGARHFFWNGYEIKIVMAGKHGCSSASIDLPTIDIGDDEPVNDAVEIVDIADKLNKFIEGN